MSQESAELRAVGQFLQRLATDRQAGVVRPKDVYQASEPRFSLAIGREYDEVMAPPGNDEDLGAAGGPSRLGPYRIERALGRGGQGTVWLAIDERLGRRVALKVLGTGGFSTADALERFQQEARVLAALDHRGLCAIFEAGEADGMRFIAMRYVDGEPLGHRLSRLAAERGALPPGQEEIDAALLLVEQAALAVHAAHEAGVVHRDLKPANLIVDVEGCPVVLDFGLARAADSDGTATVTGDVLGTPSYMAPEQAAGEVRSIDRRTDVHALGAILFECVAGRRPYEGPSRSAVLAAVRDAPLPDVRKANPNLTRDLQVVLATALAKRPGDRYATALDFADDVRRVRLDEPIMARPPTPAVRLARWVRRNPALAALAMTIVIAVVTVRLLIDQQPPGRAAGAPGATTPSETGFVNSLALHWTHEFGAPYFIDDLPSTESLFGHVDNLTGAALSSLSYTSPVITLPPGRYAAKVRLKKHGHEFESAPMDLSVVVDGVPHLVTLPVSGQPVGRWVETPPLLFNVTPTTTPIAFAFGNTDPALEKRFYLFDTFTVQAVPTVSSLATDWSRRHAAPYWIDDIPSSDSIFGVVDKLNFIPSPDGLSWLQYWTDTPLALPPGAYSAKVRFQKIVSAVGAIDLTLTAVIAAISTQATRLAVDQPVGHWVETPPLAFTIPTLTDTVKFEFGHVFGGVKGDYLFDRMEIMPVSPQLVGLLPDRKATIGATMTLDLFAPASPGLAAVCAFSFSTSPAVSLGDGRYVPIASDALTAFSLDPSNGISTNLSTVVGPDGVAAPRPTVRIPDFPGLAGITVYGAAITLDPTAPAGIVGISTAMPLQIVP